MVRKCLILLCQYRWQQVAYGCAKYVRFGISRWNSDLTLDAYRNEKQDRNFKSKNSLSHHQIASYVSIYTSYCSLSYSVVQSSSKSPVFEESGLLWSPAREKSGTHSQVFSTSPELLHNLTHNFRPRSCFRPGFCPVSTLSGFLRGVIVHCHRPFLVLVYRVLWVRLCQG